MTTRPLHQSEGQAFTCDHCKSQAVILSTTASAPSGWFALTGYETPGKPPLHACTTNCSASLKTLHKRIK